MLDLLDAFWRQLTLTNLFVIYWFYFLFEFPRFVLSSIAVAINTLFHQTRHAQEDVRVSVLLVGMSDPSGLRKTLNSLLEQTHLNLEIVVVQDGAGREMLEYGKLAERRGEISRYLCTDVRSGKAAALNLGLSYCSREYVVVADIDTSLDRDAVAVIVGELLRSPDIGGVSGDIGVRNEHASIWSALQSIEYLSNITIGRQFQSMMGILVIVSGAFGVYRREAIEQVGGWDVGPGDDSNLTTKLRLAGWRISFEPNARALTDVPETMGALWRQRLRWNRSLIRNRWRKFRSVFNPFNHRFSLIEVVAAANQIWFNFIQTFAYFAYLIYAFLMFGRWALVVILSLHLMIFVFDVLNLLQGVLLHPREGRWKLFGYLPASALYSAIFMRTNRFHAYLSELLFRDSYKDSFYPNKVRKAQEQF